MKCVFVSNVFSASALILIAYSDVNYLFAKCFRNLITPHQNAIPTA
jgi:hypothetical protein